MRLAGATAWITGASSGIGAALARELDRRGARVAVSARGAERLAEVAGERMLVAPADVTDRDSVRAAAERVRRELGPIDLAVLNAGAWEQVFVERFDPAVFRRHVDTNIMGLVHGVDAVLDDMRRRRSGTIAGVSSVAGYRGFPRSEAYGSSKAAQINLLESLRIDLSPYRIDVVTVCPGFVRTALTEQNRFPMPFMLEPVEAARRIAEGLERGRPEIVFPWQMMALMKTARLVPVGLWARALRPVARRQARRFRG